tara:strand:+ start:318 stop:515 length:198 start_codon:yes stop_codon:yes gene_type:complete
MIKCSIGCDGNLFYGRATLQGSSLFEAMEPSFMSLQQKIFSWNPNPENNTENDAKSQLLDMIREF